MTLEAQVRDLRSEIEQIGPSLTSLTPEKLEEEIIKGVNEYLDYEVQAGSLLVLSRYKTGMFANYYRSCCELQETKFGRWKDCKNNLEKKLGNKKTILYECMKIAKFQDAKNFSELGFTNIMKGIGHLYKYIDLSGYQESKKSLKLTGTYIIENIIKSYKPDSEDMVSEFKKIINNPSELFKTAIVNIAKEKNATSVVELINNPDCKLPYKDAKLIKDQMNLPKVCEDNIKSIISSAAISENIKESNKYKAFMTIINIQRELVISNLEKQGDIGRTIINFVARGFDNILQAIPVPEKRMDGSNTGEVNPYSEMTEKQEESSQPAA